MLNTKRKISALEAEKSGHIKQVIDLKLVPYIAEKQSMPTQWELSHLVSFSSDMGEWTLGLTLCNCLLNYTML